MTDEERLTLGRIGNVYVTLAAARRFLEAAGYERHEIESARRELTELLLDARRKGRQATIPADGVWRARRRSTGYDVHAVIHTIGRLLVVATVTVQTYDPPSATRRRRRAR